MAGTVSGTASILSLLFSVISVPSVVKDFDFVNPRNPRASAEKKLLPLKLRRAFLQKRLRPLGFILRRASHSKQHSFEIKSLAQRHLHPFVDGLHRILHG